MFTSIFINSAYDSVGFVWLITQMLPFLKYRLCSCL